MRDVEDEPLLREMLELVAEETRLTCGHSCEEEQKDIEVPLEATLLCTLKGAFLDVVKQAAHEQAERLRDLVDAAVKKRLEAEIDLLVKQRVREKLEEAAKGLF